MKRALIGLGKLALVLLAVSIMWIASAYASHVGHRTLAQAIYFAIPLGHTLFVMPGAIKAARADGRPCMSNPWLPLCIGFSILVWAVYVFNAPSFIA